MENQNDYNAEEIFSKALRAGRLMKMGLFTTKNIKYTYTKKTLLNLILH
jgi:hypothetical protein